MEILGSMATAGANGNDSFKLESWKKGMAGEGIMFDCALPVTVGTAGTPMVSDLINILKYFFSQFSLAYGPSQQYKAFEGIDGSELRNIFRGMSLKEVSNSFVGVAQTTGAKTLVVRLIYLFTPVYAEGRDRWVGWDVCRTMRLDLTEGATLTAGPLNLTRTAAANAIFTIVPIYRVGPNNLIHPPNFRRINQSKLDVETPEGLVFLAWDDNAPYASTTIGKNLVRIGNDDVQTNVPPAYVNDEYSALIDAGGSNIQDAVTVLYFADPFQDPEKWPHGKLYMKLISQDVSTIKLRALFWPEMGEDQVKDFVGAIAAANKKPMLATNPDADSSNPQPGVSAVGPYTLISSDDNAFQALPGVIGTPDAHVQLSIPQHVQSAVRAVAGSAHGGSKSAVASKTIQEVAKKIPGAIGTDGKRRGGKLAAQGIQEQFSDLGTLNNQQS